MRVGECVSRLCISRDASSGQLRARARRVLALPVSERDAPNVLANDGARAQAAASVQLLPYINALHLSQLPCPAAILCLSLSLCFLVPLDSESARGCLCAPTSALL
jgi:hypothetical protein